VLAEREFVAPRRPARLTLDVRVLTAHALDLRQASACHRFVNWPACNWLGCSGSGLYLARTYPRLCAGRGAPQPWNGSKVESVSAVQDGRWPTVSVRSEGGSRPRTAALAREG